MDVVVENMNKKEVFIFLKDHLASLISSITNPKTTTSNQDQSESESNDSDGEIDDESNCNLSHLLPHLEQWNVGLYVIYSSKIFLKSVLSLIRFSFYSNQLNKLQRGENQVL